MDTGEKKSGMEHKTSDLFKIFASGKKKLIDLYILMLCRYILEICFYVDVMETVYLQGHLFTRTRLGLCGVSRKTLLP